MKKLVSLTLIALILSSCAVTSFRKKSSEFLDIQKGIIQQTSKIADYRVETKVKISGNYTGSYESITANTDTDFAKQMAIGNAIKNAKCDFMVNPMFDIVVTNTKIEVSVVGYAAFYTSFETIQQTGE